jgi:hypothetical protein
MILKKILLEARIMIMALAVVGLITTLTGVYGQEEGIDASRILSPGREGGPSSGTTGPIGGGDNKSLSGRRAIIWNHRANRWWGQ